MKVQESFLETMESSLRKRQLTNKNRLGKNGNTNMQQIMQAKPSAKTPKAEQQCKHAEAGITWTSENLSQMKETHCTGYNHIDLSNTDIKNIAIYYLNKDLSHNDKKMLELKYNLRYEVKDNGCPAAPLFTANDISIQQVNMDTLGKVKEWVAVVNLNTKDGNSYLRSELPYCKVKEYLIGAKVQVKAYVDDNGCCDGWKDYAKCEGKPICANKLTVLKNINNKDYSKDVILAGTQYKVKNTYDGINGRRRLLATSRNDQGNCRL
jgi:hypothetical protein